MVSSIALGIPIAFTFLNQWWKRILIILLSVALGLVMNWIRVVLISIWHYDSAKEAIHGPHGIYELPFIFLVGVFITLAVAMAIADKTAKQSIVSHISSRDSVTGRPAKQRSVYAAIIGILVLSATVLYLGTWKAEAVHLPKGFGDFPMTIAGYQVIPGGSLGKPFYTDLAHDEHIASYAVPSGETAMVYIGYFHSQNQQQELVDYRYNWLHDGAEKVGFPSISPDFAMKKSRVQLDDKTITVFFSYDINGRNIIEPRDAKLASLFDALLSRRTNGAIVMVMFDRDVLELSDAERVFLIQVVSNASDRFPGD
jgi:exosortase/archaeosortase family protein